MSVQLRESPQGFGTEDVFVKTDKGHHESCIQTSESSLPRRLRTLLLSVDGQSPFRVYAQTLENYGDVAAMFSELRDGGYVVLAGEARASRGSRVAGVMERLSALTPKSAG
jgi:hypothetical protein